jgi:phage recombination protein Bet
MSDALAPYLEWDRERLDLIKKTYAKGTSDAEFELFIGVCKRLGLDPMAGQIYCMPTFDGVGDERSRTFKPVVSIDGYRSIAEDSGEYAGQTKPEWYDSDTNTWVDVWFGKNSPVAARIGVHRNGFREPLYRVARYDAYVQTTKGGDPNRQWRKFGAEQLLKCAEALALRAAFPRKLSGTHTPDEMGQAQNDDVVAPARVQQPTPQPKPAPDAHLPGKDRVVFRWKLNPRYDNTFVLDAPSAVIVEYIAYLNGVLLDDSRKSSHPDVKALRAKCEDILRVQLLIERQAHARDMIATGAIAQSIAPQLPERASTNLDIAGALQAIVDGRLGDPSDANNEWGMDDAESGREAS